MQSSLPPSARRQVQRRRTPRPLNLAVSHALRSWSKDAASANKLYALVTWPTFQPLSSRLNDTAPLNIQLMLVTIEAFHGRRD